MKTYQYFWQLIKYRPHYYFTDTISISIHYIIQTAVGLILRGYFNGLTGSAGLQLTTGQTIALQLLYGIILGGTLVIAIYAHIRFKYSIIALMMRNLFRRILEMPGAVALPVGPDGKRVSSGQVISTLRDDPEDMVMTMTWAEDAMGLTIMAAIAFAIMLTISPLVALGTFIPLGIIIAIAEKLGERVRQYRKVSREATSQVTGLIGDMFNGTQAIKTAHAEEHVVAHFRALNDQRKQAMVRDRLLTQTITAMSRSATDLGMGLILLLAAQAMFTKQFGVGDFVLFVAYIHPIAQWVHQSGDVLTRYKQGAVSVQRMESLMQGAPVGGPVAHHPIYFHQPLPELPHPVKEESDHLEQLAVQQLTYLYPNASSGVQDISFTVPRGAFVVITGRIGAGKTTLLKTLLGLLPAQSGKVLWNGETVAEPAHFFVPPRCAYTGQVPRLFSETVQQNILLGLAEGRVDVARAVGTAVMERDLAEMEQGLHTLVGPRGVRLSGGQVQRTAAARMFVRTPELLVFDDLSSA